MDTEPIATGAEADIYVTEYLGRPAIAKVRSPKAYRHPELDRRIRSSRIRSEARLMKDAREVGVRTPFIYDIDIIDCAITMEYISGKKIKDLLDEEPEKAEIVCRMIGEALARLHNGGISHGDLTTSNMIMTPEGRICFIDFSMGSSKIETEEMGVDIRLLERAFSSAHPGLENAYKALIDEYCIQKKDSKAVMNKVQEIKDRGRYT
ncbi:MAG: KEOPS complex kinase/ATPase Bud32 [Candidatus Methanomethylophilaceae archaeon]|jgi:TP53 regulating kinase-like protein/N6-L-threonylcarbamoyladenine synthase/protein kinase Bud32